MFKLWQRLAQELADSVDADAVALTVAASLAASAGSTALVGLPDDGGRYYNVWIATAGKDGAVEQKRWSAASAAFEPFLRAGQATLLPKLKRPTSELVTSELWLLAEEAVLATPLVLTAPQPMAGDAALIGLLDPGPDSPLDSSKLDALAAFLTVYFQRALWRQRARQRATDLDLIRALSRNLNVTLSLASILAEMTGPIREALSVEILSLGLVDSDTGEIAFVDALLAGESAKQSQIRLLPGQGIAGWVVDRGQPAVVNDAYADARFYSLPDNRSGFRTRSMICIPLEAGGRTVGVLQAINKRSGPFTDGDLQLMRAIGGPLATALENARLLDQVQARQNALDALSELIVEGTLTVTAAGRVTVVNEAMLQLLQLPIEEVVGSQADKFVDSRDSSLSTYLDRIIKSGKPQAPIRIDLRRSNRAAIPALLSGAPLANAAGEIRAVSLLFSDARLPAELDRMRQDFLESVVAELRLPLASILIYARLLRGGKASQPGKADRFLSIIERESNRLQTMIRQMQDLAALQSDERHRRYESVDLNVVLQQTLPPLARLAEDKRLQFLQEVEPSLPIVLGDPEIYRLIFGNVVENAIRYTLSGSVTVRVTADGAAVNFEVIDEGIGIPEESLPYLFKPFYRAQPAVDRGIAGTGLGLYLVKESLEKYNGSLVVTTGEGVGTTILVRLPAIQM